MQHPFSKSDRETFVTLIEESQQIVIVSHKSPDGDSVGSSMAMYHLLKQWQPEKNIHVCHPDVAPEFIQWADEHKVIRNFQDHQAEVEATLNHADLIICLDFNDLSRVGKDMEPVLANASAKKVMIDHHMHPSLEQFYLSFSYPNHCSTCELLMELILATDHGNLISPELGACLYLGLVTDTGSFRFNSVRKETHQLVAMLLDAGVNHTAVHERTFDDNTLERIRLRSYILSECLEVWPEVSAAVLYLKGEDIKRLPMQKGDTEGLVNVALSIKGVTRAAFFKDEDDYIRISFRSKDGKSVNSIAQKYFQGGGHQQASGGRYDGSLEEAIAKFKEVLQHEVD
jgi:phosphoesterase RecJ-like protein